MAMGLRHAQTGSAGSAPELGLLRKPLEAGDIESVARPLELGVHGSLYELAQDRSTAVAVVQSLLDKAVLTALAWPADDHVWLEQVGTRGKHQLD